MSLIFFQSLIIAVFSFGTVIFYALSCIERPVINLWLNQCKVIGNHDIIRFIHNELKKLIPLLPPSNDNIVNVKTGLSKLFKLHHQGLFANLFTVILQIIFTTIN